MQLINVLEDCTYATECGKSVDVIYLDYNKAFDCVLHAHLIAKLHGYEIDGLLFKWIKDFLTNQKQQLCVRGSYCSWCNVIHQLTGLLIGYSVIVALTGLSIGCSVIIALTRHASIMLE